MHKQSDVAGALWRPLVAAVAVALMVGACEVKTPTGPEKVTATSTTSTSTIAPSTSAAFVYSPTAPSMNQVVVFNAVESVAAGGRNIVAYAWDFGDGTTGTGVTASHVYARESTYLVVLTLTDDGGGAVTVSQAVSVVGLLSTTTTTALPTFATVRYLSQQVPDSVPSDLTLVFQFLRGAAVRPAGKLLNELAPQAAAATYSVQGVYRTTSGVSGGVQGEMVGVLTPSVVGTFTGTLTATVGPCRAERRFAGQIDQLLLWTAGEILSNCEPTPWTYPSLTLVKSATPAPTTTSTTTTTTTTTTIPPFGTLTGSVLNASNGQPIAGATVTVGAVSTTSGAGGAYTLSNVPAGVQTVAVASAGFTPRTDSVSIVAGATTIFSPALAPITGSITISLSWGAQPLDLDAHLVGPGIEGTFEVYWNNRNPVPWASLDVDDVNGTGPETITVSSNNGLFVPGVYTYFVHNYTAFGPAGNGTPGFNASVPPAVVTVSQQGIQRGQFVASNATGNPATAEYWRVFSFTLTATPSGQISITPIQRFESPTLGLFPSSLKLLPKH